MTRRPLAAVLLVILALVLAAELLLPALMGKFMTRGAMDLLHTNKVSAETAGRPALLMLGGHFDTILLDAVDVKTHALAFHELHARLTGVQLDTAALLVRRAVELQAVRDVSLEAVITEADLAAYLNQSVKGIKNAAVAVTDGHVQVSSTFSLGGLANVAITLEGKIVGDGSEIKFVTDRFIVNNRSAGNLGGLMMAEITLADLKKLPFAAKVRSVTMEAGKVVIQADNRVQ